MSLQPGPDDPTADSSLTPPADAAPTAPDAAETSRPTPGSPAPAGDASAGWDAPPPPPAGSYPPAAWDAPPPPPPPGYGAPPQPWDAPPPPPPPGGYGAPPQPWDAPPPPPPGAYGAEAPGQVPGWGAPPPPPPGGYGAPPQPWDAPPPPPAGSYPPPGYGAFPSGQPGQYAAPKQTESKAIIGLVLALVSWLLCPIVLAIAALVVAGQSNRAIDASGGRLEGRSLNTATKWVAWINIVLYGLALVAMLVFFGWLATQPDLINEIVNDPATQF